MAERRRTMNKKFFSFYSPATIAERRQPMALPVQIGYSRLSCPLLLYQWFTFYSQLKQQTCVGCMLKWLDQLILIIRVLTVLCIFYFSANSWNGKLIYLYSMCAATARLSNDLEDQSSYYLPSVCVSVSFIYKHKQKAKNQARESIIY